MNDALITLLIVAIVSVYGIGIGLSKALMDNDGEMDENIAWAVIWPLTAVMVLLFVVLIMPGVAVYDRVRKGW